MPNRIVSYLPAVAVGLFIIAIAFSTNRTLAADDCLAQPNRQPASGGHWYYRSDPVSDRKCWHLVEQTTTPQTEAPDTQQPSPNPTFQQSRQSPGPPSVEQAGGQPAPLPNQAERGAFEE